MAHGTVKYMEVREHLQRRIAKMPSGKQIPPEPVLCREYGVSRITIRRAVEELIRDGLLVREQGRGTFVTEPRFTQEAHETFANRVTGFYRQQTALGRSVTTRMLRNTVTRDPSAAAALDLNAGDEVILLERLRYVDGRLHQHVVTYLPAARYPAVATHDFARGSLFEFIERKYDVQLARNDLLVRLQRADQHLAGVLDVSEGESLLAIDSTVYDRSEQAVAFGVATHTPEYSEIAFSLRNDPDTHEPAKRAQE